MESLAVLPATVKEPGFDPLKDLPAVMGILDGTYVLTTATDSPLHSFDDLVKAAKASPGKLNTGGSTTNLRLLTVALAQLSKLDVVYVPYTSGAPYTLAIKKGEIQFGLVGIGTAANGDYRALALTGDQRSQVFANVPTFAELGMPDIVGTTHTLNV